MRAVAFVYTDLSVCLRALTEHTVVLLLLSSCTVCMCVCTGQKCLRKQGCFFNGAFRMNTQGLSGCGSRKPCMCVCVCSLCVRVANDHNVSRHITQHISLYTVGYNESIFDISSSTLTQEMLSTLVSVRGDEVSVAAQGEWTCQSSDGLLYVF